MGEMKIKINEIPPEGRSLSLPFEPSWMRAALAGVDAEAADRPSGAEVEVHKIADNVQVHGRIYGSIGVPCARCLARALVDLSGPIRMTYTRDEEMAEAELESIDDDVDFSVYDGEEIDLGELFREQILLAIPMTPLCREECKGLCSQCGKDLNEGPCDCDRQGPADARWSALKGLKLD
jgi:uncharacterized protein